MRLENEGFCICLLTPLTLLRSMNIFWQLFFSNEMTIFFYIEKFHDTRKVLNSLCLTLIYYAEYTICYIFISVIID